MQVQKSSQAYTHLYYAEESQAIPIEDCVEAISMMRYADPVRVGFILLYLSGARVSELDNMHYSYIYGTRLFWKKGKNQKGKPRYIDLPDFFLKEIEDMRKIERCSDKILPIDAYTFRRYFTKIRPSLGAKWTEKLPWPKGGRVSYEYRYQIKGLRKLFSSKVFYDKWKEYGDAGAAMEFASKKLGHAHRSMTCMHYLVEDKDRLGIPKYYNRDLADALKENGQSRLLEWM